MIVDGETYDLVNAIERLLDDAPDGEIKPELMESVLEISTHPCPNTARRRRAAARAAPQRARQGDGPRPDHRLGGHAPVRAVGAAADRRAHALPRPHLRAALRRPPGADLRDARPRRASTTPTRRSTSPTGCASTAGAAGAERQLAVLARRTHSGCMSTRTPIFRAFPRVGIPPAYHDWDDYERADRVHGAQRRRWRTTRTSGTTCARIRSSGPSRSACATPRRGSSTRWARRAHPGDGARAVRALRVRRALRRLPVADARREQVAGRASRARRRARRPALQRAGPDEGAGAAPAGPSARARRGPRVGRAIWTASRT